MKSLLPGAAFAATLTIAAPVWAQAYYYNPYAYTYPYPYYGYAYPYYGYGYGYPYYRPYWGWGGGWGGTMVGVGEVAGTTVGAAVGMAGTTTSVSTPYIVHSQKKWEDQFLDDLSLTRSRDYRRTGVRCAGLGAEHPSVGNNAGCHSGVAG